MGALAVGRVRAADLDAVTIDAYGTLVTLVDPVPTLAEALAARGVNRPADVVRAGFRTEVAYYQQRASSGYDSEELEHLQRDCAGVFLDAVDADLDTGEFAPVYAGAMHFLPLPGVSASLQRLRALGLELAVVANWDVSLGRLLDEVELTRYFTTVVHAAAKPAPAGLLQALAAVGVDAARALHIGDDTVDEQAARAAGTLFAPAPLSEAVAELR
jgi:phosphoglycolate phosphatase-like HAD superfamily hydrolase